MKLLLYKNELNSFIESYETSIIKDYIKYSVHPDANNGKEGVKDSYWVEFDKSMDDSTRVLLFVFRAGVIHGESLNK